MIANDIWTATYVIVYGENTSTTHDAEIIIRQIAKLSEIPSENSNKIFFHSLFTFGDKLAIIQREKSIRNQNYLIQVMEAQCMDGKVLPKVNFGWIASYH